MRLNRDQRGLLYSGALWALYEAVTAGFLIVFAIALGASNTIVGILGAIPAIAMMLMEIPGAKLVEYFKRKTIFLMFTGLSRCTWVLIILIPYLFREHALFLVGAFFFLLRCFEYIADPAWSSWAADIIPEKHRGAFWGRRNMLTGLTGMLGSLAAGAYLDLFPHDSYLGFATLFGCGIVIGLLSNLVQSRVNEPEYRDHNHHSLREFFKVDGQFRAYVWIMVAYYFGVNLASPLFTAYMLHDLGLSYTYFVIAGAVATVSRILAHPHLGYVSDRFGDKPVAVMSLLGTALVPLAFIFVTKEALWLIIPAQILSGIAWAGHDLSTWNMLLDLTHRDKRAMQVAEYNLLTSIPMAISPVIGGLIADNLALGLTGIPLVFAIAFVLRAVPAMLLTRIHETRTGPERPIGEVFAHVMTIHPFHGMERAIKIVIKRIRDEYTHIRAPYPVNGKIPRFEPPRVRR
jgi:MFS family permease